MSDPPPNASAAPPLAAPMPRPVRAAAGERRRRRPARVLNQAEIDSLLGFDDGPPAARTAAACSKIISSGLVSYERLPMLEIVFDRLVRIMSTSLRNFTSDNVEVGIDNILSLRFGDYLNSHPAAGACWRCSRPRSGTITG